eukprot:5892053-Amphidinium_carterae.1
MSQSPHALYSRWTNSDDVSSTVRMVIPSDCPVQEWAEALVLSIGRGILILKVHTSSKRF